MIEPVNKTPCTNCGSVTWAVNLMNACNECECPKPKKGELSEYCKTGIMHFNCHGLNGGCACECHPEIQKEFPLKKEYRNFDLPEDYK